MKFPTKILATALIPLSFLSSASGLLSGDKTITRQDRLRGEITPQRAWWDLQHYTLKVKVDPSKKFLSGSNIMTYKVLDDAKQMQIDLQPPMNIDSITQDGKKLSFKRDGNAFFVDLEKAQAKGKEYQLTINFSGHPTVAKRAPWDGGLTWSKDSNGLDFAATSNQGIGASIWWPNKDHGYDEPDKGIVMEVEVPEHLVDVSNGRLKNVSHNKSAKTKTYTWEVVNPINNYGVNLNVGDYVNFKDVYQGEKGKLDFDFWVLRENLEKAKVQFKQAAMTIEALEHWFGPYPFYEDSFKLVEAPYLGMEHQSSVTYGNGYQNGYRGRDLSGSGSGMLFDFIIVHETGHEWFANNITNKDIADMWIHESFTNYSETLYLEYHFGKEKAFKYVRGLRQSIQNDRPIIGTYNVNKEGSGDMYYKGANMLHTIRMVINDDEKFRSILRGLNKDFYHQTVTTQQVENYISEKSGIDFSTVFDQYLRDVSIPTFEYVNKDGMMMYRWSQVPANFVMPLKVTVDGKEQWITPKAQWQVMKDVKSAPVPDKNFYINTLNTLGD